MFRYIFFKYLLKLKKYLKKKLYDIDFFFNDFDNKYSNGK